MVSEEELKKKYTMMSDVWRLYRKFADVKADDSYWEQLINESNQVSKKYNDSKFAIALLLAVVDELERIGKEMMKNAEAF